MCHIRLLTPSLALLLVLCVMQTAVADAQPEPAPQSQSESNAAGDVEADAIPEETTVEVLDPGEGERQELRYRFEIGREERLVVMMDMNMSMAFNGQLREMRIPTVRSTMDVAVAGLTENGHYRQVFELVAFEVEAGADDQQQMVDAMREQLAAMEGISGVVVVTAWGELVETQVDLPAGAPPHVRQQMDQLRRSMDQVMVTLPTEPVSRGARWRVVSPIRSRQLNMVQRTTYRLLEREDDRVTLAVDVEQSAPPQSMGEAMGRSVMLREYEAQGEGEVTMNLRRLTSNAEISMAMQMAQAIGEQVQHIEMKMQMRTEPAADE